MFGSITIHEFLSGAGASKKSTNCSQPVTQVNEAYGLLPTSIHSPLSN